MAPIRHEPSVLSSICPGGEQSVILAYSMDPQRPWLNIFRYTQFIEGVLPEIVRLTPHTVLSRLRPPTSPASLSYSCVSSYSSAACSALGSSNNLGDEVPTVAWRRGRPRNRECVPSRRRWCVRGELPRLRVRRRARQGKL